MRRNAAMLLLQEPLGNGLQNLVSGSVIPYFSAISSRHLGCSTVSKVHMVEMKLLYRHCARTFLGFDWLVDRQTRRVHILVVSELFSNGEIVAYGLDIIRSVPPF
jgi:hypothetical protein